MITLHIPAMSCSHCVGVITRTIKALDADASIDFDLAFHTVNLSSDSELEVILDALSTEGYPATVMV